MKRLITHSFIALLVAGAWAPTGAATTITLQPTDASGTGFFDSTPRAPVQGNDGTTLGEQRRNAFNAAADFWESRLDSEVEIIVSASFANQACLNDNARLASATPADTIANFGTAPERNTLYVVALANALEGVDRDPARPDIIAAFNGQIDAGNADCINGLRWDYRLGIDTDSALQFYATAVHELAHGLGFGTIIRPDGARPRGMAGVELNDQFMTNLFDGQLGGSWTTMTDAQRSASFVNGGSLVWAGPRASGEAAFLSAGVTGGNPRLFAPDPPQGGASVVHWDTTLSPNELMEPSVTSVRETWLTLKAMYDMGWPGNPCQRTPLPRSEWLQISLDCLPPAGERTVADVFGDDIDGVYDEDWRVYRFVPAVGASGKYQALGLNDTLVLGEGYFIKQQSGDDVVLDVSRDSSRTPTPNRSGVCPSVAGCFERSLASDPKAIQHNLIGNPFREGVSVDTLVVVTDAGTCATGCDLETADANGIASNELFAYQGSPNGFDRLSGDAVLQGRSGAWLGVLPEAAALNPRLLIPR